MTEKELRERAEQRLAEAFKVFCAERYPGFANWGEDAQAEELQTWRNAALLSREMENERLRNAETLLEEARGLLKRAHHLVVDDGSKLDRQIQDFLKRSEK